MKNSLAIVLLLVVLGAGGYWVLSNQQAQPAMTESVKTDEIISETTPSETMESDGMMAKNNVTEIAVEGSEFKYEPSEMNAKAGEPVKIVFRNVGKMPHDFVIDELNVKTAVLEPGEEETVVFTPEEAGIYEYYCSVGRHREQGMVGTLTVK